MSDFGVVCERAHAHALRGRAEEVGQPVCEFGAVTHHLKIPDMLCMAKHRNAAGRDLFLVKSPKEGRLAATASESLEALQKVSWPKRRMTGAQLMAALAPGQEIVIVYADGGDRVTSEQLEWFKQIP